MELRIAEQNYIGFDIFGGGGNLSLAQGFSGFFILSETNKFRQFLCAKRRIIYDIKTCVKTF